MSTFSCRRPFLGLVAVIAFIAAWGSPAQAAVLTYGPTLHNNGGAGYGNGATGSFTVPQFDDLGGALVLTKVTLTVQVNSTGGKQEFDSESSSGATITLGIGSQVRVKGPVPGLGSQLAVNPDATETTAPTFVTADTDGLPPDFIGTDSLSITGVSATDTKSGSKTSIFDMAPYIGTGDVTFDFDGGNSTTGTSALPSPGSVRITSTNFDFLVTVEYEYIPEPATLALFAVGGLGSMLLRRKRK